MPEDAKTTPPTPIAVLHLDREYRIPLDALWIDRVEEACGEGLLAINERFVQWQENPASTRLGMFFRVLLGFVRRVDPGMTDERLAALVPMTRLAQVMKEVGDPWNQVLIQIAGTAGGDSAGNASSSPSAASDGGERSSLASPGPSGTT